MHTLSCQPICVQCEHFCCKMESNSAVMGCTGDFCTGALLPCNIVFCWRKDEKLWVIALGIWSAAFVTLFYSLCARTGWWSSAVRASSSSSSVFSGGCLIWTETVCERNQALDGHLQAVNRTAYSHLYMCNFLVTLISSSV